jgi:dolichyl-phosphate-mannose-protein mannosyltransferase
LRTPPFRWARRASLTVVQMPRHEPNARLTVALVTGICIAGALLRVWQIGRFGLNSDEAVYAGQGAAIAGVPELGDIFPIFRAHPLLFQLLVGLLYRAGISDLTPRLLSVVFAIGTVAVVFALGKLLFGRSVGIVAALLVAVMPYHVVVSRQALLDCPMAFFATCTLYLLARYVVTERAGTLYASAAAMGLTVLTKESGILYLSAAYAFFALTATVRVPLRRIVVALAILAVVILPFPLSLLLGGGAETGKAYLVWQLFRDPNHPWQFYLVEVPAAVGPLVLLAAVLWLREVRASWSWRETLLVSWILAPLLLFQLWPVKGYQYPLPIVAPLAVLASAYLVTVLDKARGGSRWIHMRAWAALAIVVLTLVVTSWGLVGQQSTGELLAGTGGVPGGREVGEWIAEQTPEGSVFMTVGPSMANLIKFYGRRDAFGLSVSPNPLHRNPSYEPLHNPDLQLRDNELQYIVWDAYSSSRSPFFSDRLLGYIDIYNGQVVFSYTVPVETGDGRDAEKAVIVIYEVRPTLRTSPQGGEEEKP